MNIFDLASWCHHERDGDTDTRSQPPVHAVKSNMAANVEFQDLAASVGG